MARRTILSPRNPCPKGIPTRSATGYPTPFWMPFWPKNPRRGWPAKPSRHQPVVIGGEVGLSDQDKLQEYMGRIEQIARDCIKDIGYEQEKFHWNTCE